MTPTTETWLPVVGYEGLYEVSDLGRVRSLDRTVPSGRGTTRRIAGRVLSPSTNATGGRRQVQLCHDGAISKRWVYAVVLEAFAGPCPPGMEGCHGDGNASNDRLDNLRWDTRSNNSFDAVRHGVHPEASKTHCPSGHALVQPNLEAAAWREGRRKCLACARAAASASWWLRKRGQRIDRKALANEHYDRIMQ